MMLLVFAVLDSKVGSFGVPFTDQREASAIRNFSDAVNDGSNPNNIWHKHPEDFSLYRVGSYDADTGELIPEKLKNLVTASAVRQLSGDVPSKNGSELELALGK